CRDNILLLSRIITNTLERGEEGVVVFLDYKAAFDSVSHLFLDESLGVAGASDKTRCPGAESAVYRAGPLRGRKHRWRRTSTSSRCAS
ncbi:MAG: hypothetical protein KUG77_04710, partial [Nannocystaceae bacterium]|nr:hypothetical protein [Nannocystaceae bacterium]